MLMLNKPRLMPAAVRAQRGAVLVVALIFLILLTILAISASGRSLLQERMAGGLSNAQQAEMSAQTALRGAEWKLWTNAIHAVASSASNGGVRCGENIFTNCYYYDPSNTVTSNFRTNPGWVTAGAIEYKGYADGNDYTAFTTTGQSGDLARNPWYIIEDMGQVKPESVGGPLCEAGITGSCPGGSSAKDQRHIYRITARGVGASANTVRVIESTFMALKAN